MNNTKKLCSKSRNILGWHLSSFWPDPAELSFLVNPVPCLKSWWLLFCSLKGLNHKRGQKYLLTWRGTMLQFNSLPNGEKFFSDDGFKSCERGNFPKVFMFDWSVSTPGKLSHLSLTSLPVSYYDYSMSSPSGLTWHVQGRMPTAKGDTLPGLHTLFEYVTHCQRQPVPLKVSHWQFAE